MLCIKLASRGDLLLAAPAFRALRRRRHQARITLLVGASCEDVARHLPYFDEIQVLDDRALLAGGVVEQGREAWRLLRRMLRPAREAWSEVLILHRDWRYTVLAWLAGVPVRRGFHGRLGRFFLTHPYHPSRQEHHVLQYLGVVTCQAGGVEDLATGQDHLVRLAGSWQFADGEGNDALKLASTHGFQPSRGNWIALGFGGGHNVKIRTELKRWPIGSWRHLADQLIKQDHRVVWVGDTEDAKLLGDGFAGVSLAGKLTVPQTAAVLAACRAVVANDTLTLHLAETLGIPTIGIFGPTDPAHYRPLGAKSAHLWLGKDLPCSPCHRDGWFPPCAFDHRCMRELTVESVLRKVEELG